MKKSLKILLSFSLLTACLWTSAVPVLAAGPPPADNLAHPQVIPCVPSLPCVTETTQSTGDKTRDFFINTFGAGFLKVFLGLCAIASVIFIIVGGVQMQVASGNEELLGQGKKTIIWAIAGLLVSILSAGIVQIITRLPFGS